LPRVYDSLLQQTASHSQFEWLVIDDGSQDDTRALLSRWSREATFAVRYLWQSNSGKHVAVNRGVREARGGLLLILDSDDKCIPDTIERFLHHWDRLADSDKYFGIGCLCQDENGKIIGKRFEVEEVASLKEKYRFIQVPEGWAVLRTDLLRQFPYPEFAGEKYCDESLVWNRLFSLYRLRLINEALRIYYQDPRDTKSITSRQRRLRIENIQGTSEYYKQLMFSRAPLRVRLRATVARVAFRILHVVDSLQPSGRSR